MEALCALEALAARVNRDIFGVAFVVRTSAEEEPEDLAMPSRYVQEGIAWDAFFGGSYASPKRLARTPAVESGESYRVLVPAPPGGATLSEIFADDVVRTVEEE